MAGRHCRPRPRKTVVRGAALLGVTALGVPLAPGSALAEVTPGPYPPDAPISRQHDGTRGEVAVQKASEHYGKPYQWGAEGPASFDCSGLTMYVYDELGVDLPRSAQDQRDATASVPKSDAQPGDLVFFHDETGHIYHVGIYAGDHEIWAATKPGDVVRKEQIWTEAYTVGRP